jgi:hypothetical protein
MFFCHVERKEKSKSQKIEMKNISNGSNLHVTVSKHHNRIFKIASEHCTLCDADVALIVCSLSENVFSFGFSNVDMFIDCYLSRFPPQNNGTMQLCELNSQLTQINNVLDIEKRCSDNKLSHMLKMTEADYWWA